MFFFLINYFIFYHRLPKNREQNSGELIVCWQQENAYYYLIDM